MENVVRLIGQLIKNHNNMLKLIAYFKKHNINTTRESVIEQYNEGGMYNV